MLATENAYDAAGRCVSRATAGSAMSETRTEDYGYNTRGELTSVPTLQDLINTSTWSTELCHDTKVEVVR